MKNENYYNKEGKISLKNENHFNEEGKNNKNPFVKTFVTLVPLWLKKYINICG